MAVPQADAIRSSRDILERAIKLLLNNELKAVCKEEGLTVSGVKATLQNRIITHVNEIVHSEDAIRFGQIYSTIDRYTATKLPTLNLPTGHGPNASAMPLTMSHASGTHHGRVSFGFHQQHTNGNTSGMATFKKSPFYDMRESLSHPTSLPVASSRSTVNAFVTFNHAQLLRMSSESSMRVMVYCSADHDASPKDISFPNQCELKCNNESFSGSLRGIKKKSGTTKPADITPFLRKTIGFRNMVSIAYQASDRRYTFTVHLVKRTLVDELVQKIKTGHVLTKQSVIHEMKKLAEDEDVIATSTKMSLKCPLSAMRIQIPCRSTLCNHNQCFDATSFLQLQEQAPQWQCPICNRTFSFEALVIDQFVEDILRNTPSDTEQVTIEPDGTWSLQSDTPSKQQSVYATKVVASTSTSYKRKLPDIFDLDEPSTSERRPNGFRSGSFATSTPQTFSTPTFTSREPSTSTSTISRSASKRPAEEVIDLTLSDDEDEQPPRRPGPVKRQSTGTYLAATTPTSFTSASSFKAPLPQSAPSRSAPSHPEPRHAHRPHWTPAPPQPPHYDRPTQVPVVQSPMYYRPSMPHQTSAPSPNSLPGYESFNFNPNSNPSPISYYPPLPPQNNSYGPPKSNTWHASYSGSP